MAQVVETAAIDASNTVEAITAEEPVEEEKQ
jgi:hypothetical protein